MINAKKYQIPKSQTKKIEKMMKGFDKGVGQYLNTGVQEESHRFNGWSEDENMTLWKVIKFSLIWIFSIVVIADLLILLFNVFLSGIDYLFYLVDIETHVDDWFLNTFIFLKERDDSGFLFWAKYYIIKFFIKIVEFGPPLLFLSIYIKQSKTRWVIWRNTPD